MIKLLHSFQRFSNARVDATLVVIFLVVFQIISLCSLIFDTLGISILSNFQMVKSFIGSLHTPEVIEKFRKLGASEEVLLVLQQGLYMPYEDSMIPKNEFFTHNKGDYICLLSLVRHILYMLNTYETGQGWWINMDSKTYFENREFANQQIKIWELKGYLHKRNSSWSFQCN